MSPNQHAKHVKAGARGVVPRGVGARICQQPPHQAELHEQTDTDQASMPGALPAEQQRQKELDAIAKSATNAVEAAAVPAAK